MSTPDGAAEQHVAHLTSVHRRTDSRVFNKQCRSLAQAGYRVTLVVADGLGNAQFGDKLRVVDVGAPPNRLSRMIWTTKKVFERAVELDANLYQLHDPELLPIGLKLKRMGKRVIFDSHEDVPKQILGKTYLPQIVLRVIASVFRPFEAWAVGSFDAVIGATPSITEKFRPLTRLVANVNNYPLLGELRSDTEWSEKRKQVCYVGGISAERGILLMIDALERTSTGANLELAGPFPDSKLKSIAAAKAGWVKVDYRGYCDREEVKQILARSAAGMVVMAPVPNHIDAQPNKLFEYMSAGIPVIASDFPLWREIVVGLDCGLCVDPLNAQEIAAAIDEIVLDSERAAKMGRNGQEAVHKVFNWAVEERKLVQLYRELLA